jgi:hypothetical protein
MVRPVQFRMNETAVNNYYQNQELQQQIEEKTYNKHGARRVWRFSTLQNKGIEVIIVNDDDTHV